MSFALTLIILFIVSLYVVGYSGEPAQPLKKSELSICIRGISPKGGKLGVLLFDKAKGFPDQLNQAMHKKWIPLSDDVTTEVTTLFPEITFGKYAVSVFQDINNNDRLDKQFLTRKPLEPWGCSNNPRPLIRSPRFSEARFAVSGKSAAITIILDR